MSCQSSLIINYLQLYGCPKTDIGSCRLINPAALNIYLRDIVLYKIAIFADRTQIYITYSNEGNRYRKI
jgi:hypothetical protein